MTTEEMDFIGSMNMCGEISNEAYKKIMCHCEKTQPCEDCISREQAIKQCGFGMTSLLIADYLRKLPSVTPKAEQKAVLDKIKAEIEQLTSRYSISKERGGMGIVEWSDRFIEESDVLQIIDQYKAEIEDNKDGKV